MGKPKLVLAAIALIPCIIGIGITTPFLSTVLPHPVTNWRLQNLRVAYYNGEGAWIVDDIIIPHLVAWMGCEFTTIRGPDIQAGALNDVDVLIWPGGHYPAYWEEVGLLGKEKIQEFITNGGGYFGICAGAYYACDYIVWMDDADYPPPDYKVDGDELNLDLVPGVAWGPIFEIADRIEVTYAMTQINIVNHSHPVTKSLPQTFQTLYAGGPYILPYADSGVTVLATYHLTGDPAIVACTYGNGRVFLIGPHAEIEEHGYKDGWLWPPSIPEPIDIDSDWPLLFAAMKWLGNITVNTLSTQIHPFQ